MESTSRLDDSLVRFIIKKVRKSKGLRQKDIEDFNLSSATISNIERGEVDPRDDTFTYLLKKLGLNGKILDELIQEEKEDMENLQFCLDGIETMLDNEKVDFAKNKLDKIDLYEFHPLAPYLNYLKGRYFYKNNDWKKASKCFEHAVNLCKQHKIEPQDNIISICYNQLSNCSFHQHNLDQALTYVKNGLDAYDDTKQRKDILHLLLSNKVLYLMKSSQSDYASQVLNELWESISEVESVSLLLNLYNYHSTLLREREAFDEAIRICNEGIQIAKKNRIQNRQLDLLNVLGSIYLKQKMFSKALQCFQMVLDIDKDADYPRIYIDAHTYLGILYLAQRDWTSAYSHLQQSIDIGRNVFDVFRLTKALIVQGNCFFYQQKYAEAVLYYQEAVDLTGEHGFKHRQYTALLKLANCFDMLNEKDHFVASIKQIYEIQKELNIKSEDELYEP